MTLEEAKKELEKFVKLKTTQRPAFLDVILEGLDYEELVRCKDCIHHTGHWFCDAWFNSPGFPIVKDDGFCWMAEKREEAEDG